MPLASRCALLTSRVQTPLPRPNIVEFACRITSSMSVNGIAEMTGPKISSRAITGTAVRAEFGPSGVMRERIEKGERVDVFASADMGHPLRLEQAKRASAVAMFARNAVCALATARVGLTSQRSLCG